MSHKRTGLLGDNTEVLFFILIFLLLFYCPGGFRFGGYSCASTAE